MQKAKEREEALNRLKENDREAKAKGQLVGRYISEPIADGEAYYVITRENKESVRIEHVEISEYIIPHWGKATTIPKTYLRKALAWREIEDMIAEEVAKKNGEA